MTAWLESLSQALTQNMWLAPLVALAAGVLTSLMPCSLASVPLVIGYVSGAAPDKQDKRRALKLSLTFALGLALAFTVLGVAAALAGRLMGGMTRWWYLALGVLMILMALQTWELFDIIPSSYLVSKSTRRGYMGALLAGALGGLFSTPCSTPVLIALLAMVAGQGQLAWGIVLLLLYAVGHSALAVAAGTSAGFARRITGDPKYGKLSQALRIVMGSLILLMGFYLLYLAF